MLFHKTSIISLILILNLFIISGIYSQSEPDWFTEYKTIVPGKNYDAGAIHELFFGAHWRDVWTTPVKVGVINLSKYGGGLTPTEKGGGLQTKALKFKGGDGKEYKFRSLDKDPQKTLPLELQESIAKDIIQDQISSSNPYAGFVVNPILDAVGVYHSEYTLAVLPDDPLLGEYQKEFGGLTGIMEIVPDEVQFEGSDKVISTVKLLDRLNKEFDESVDSRAFLKARLLDIFFGDWDRHKDQWKWIRYKDGESKVYKPFPMDRDQAFAKFDGLLPFVAEQNIPQLNNFGHSYPKLRYMTWSGRYLDQRFLNFLSKEAWDEVTNDVVSKLTDDVIENAVKQLPPEVYSKAKDEIVSKLISRRDGLKEASRDYYELVNTIVDIYLSDKDDMIRLGFNPMTNTYDPKSDNNDFTETTIFERKSDEVKGKDEILRQKRFNNDITEELRIYLQDGDDEVIITGKSDNSPKIRIIGGDGKDIVNNSSDENVLFYDDGKKSETKGDVTRDDDKYETKYDKLNSKFKGLKDKISKEEKKEYEEQLANLRYDPVMPPDKFNMSSFFPIFLFNPDAGPFFGGAFSYKKYGFRMDPYLYKLNFSAGYAPKKKDLTGLVADLDFDFRGIVKRSQFNFHFRKSGLEINNYFGRGNNTFFSTTAYEEGIFEVTHEEYIVDPSLIFPANKPLSFNAGIIYKNFDVKQNDKIEFAITGVSTQPINLLGISGGVTFDKRDHPTAPFSGYYFDLKGKYYPSLFEKHYDFAKISGDIRGYLGYKQSITLGLRLWGEKVIGDFPFFESAFLGGSKLLRGFAGERFAGDGSLLGSAELRLKLFNMNILLPQSVGIFTFAETGRVFVKGETSNLWHTGYGGGLFMFLLNRDITFRLTYARSKEIKQAFYFGTGFTF
jgi:hypothetical protein